MKSGSPATGGGHADRRVAGRIAGSLAGGLGFLGGIWGGEAGTSLAVVAGAFLCTLAFGSWNGRAGVGAWLCLVLAAAPLLALLPTALYDEPLWRAAIAGALPFPLGGSWAPNTWGVLREWPAHLAVVGLLVWLQTVSSPWRPWRGLREGALVLAALVSLVLAFQRWDSGFWLGPHRALLETVFGTRNQAGTFAALALVGGLCMGFGSKSGPRRLAWLACAAAGLWGIFALGSRGAAMAGAAGILVAAVRLRVPAPRVVPVVSVVVLVAVAGFVSSPLAKRVMGEGLGGWERRAAIQRDAWGVLAGSPLQGTGLGNFGEVFVFYRDASADANDVRHPESDWLWHACENGLDSGLAAAGLAALFVWRWLLCRDPALSACGLGCIAVVLSHGLLDVPMHAPVLAFLAVPLCAVGGPGPPCGEPARRIFRILLLSAMAAVLVAESAFFRLFPRERPAGFSPHRPIADIPSVRELERWLGCYPLDARVIEIWGHAAARAGNPRGYQAIRAALLVGPWDPSIASRAGSLARELGDAAEEDEFAAEHKHREATDSDGRNGE